MFYNNVPYVFFFKKKMKNKNWYTRLIIVAFERFLNKHSQQWNWLVQRTNEGLLWMSVDLGWSGWSYFFSFYGWWNIKYFPSVTNEGRKALDWKGGGVLVDLLAKVMVRDLCARSFYSVSWTQRAILNNEMNKCVAIVKRLALLIPA